MVEFHPELRRMALECPECEKSVVAEPKGYFTIGEDQDGEGEEIDAERWTLFSCEQRHPILIHETEKMSEWTTNGGIVTVYLDDPYRVYPPQDRALSTEIPVELRQIHDEARACIRAKAYMAAAVISGRALEGVCDLNNVPGRTLQERLSRMKENGLIEGRLWDWAETLRGVRNAAAHFGKESISRQDAEDAVAFTEALLDYLYVLSARFNALKERRTRRGKDSEKDGSGGDRRG
jgi:hypothetical protein